jgi:hypothetical protein
MNSSWKDILANFIHTRSKMQDRAIIIHATMIKWAHEQIKGHEQGYGEPPISQSLQAKDRERDVRVLDPKGLVGNYLGTHDLDTSQMY